MAKLPKGLSGKTIVKLFQKTGWIVKRQKGSHVTLKKDGVEAILTIPLHQSVDRGTLRNLIRIAELDVEDFISNMK